jgi:hypothetical protein
MEWIMTTAFETWHAKEVEKGLIDIKFAVVRGKGVSAEAIQNELLGSEAALAQGFLRPAPQATSMVPDRITAFVNQA